MIAAAASAHVQALTSKAKFLAGGNAGRNADLGRPVESWNLDACSKCGFPGCDRNFSLRIVTSDCKSGVRLLAEAHVKVTAVGPSSGNTNAAVMTCARRNADVDNFFCVSEPDRQFASRSTVHVFQRQGELRFSVRA